jgi:hypothetical protein
LARIILSHALLESIRFVMSRKECRDIYGLINRSGAQPLESAAHQNGDVSLSRWSRRRARSSSPRRGRVLGVPFLTRRTCSTAALNSTWSQRRSQSSAARSPCRSPRKFRLAKSHLKLVNPTEVNRTVAPTRRPNAELRTREHLTSGEVEALVEAAKANRHGHRDATMILLAFRGP